MKNILFLTTGGTIASSKGIEGLIPKYSAKDILSYIPKLKTICNISYRNVLSIDSSNMQPEEWIIIAKEIYKALKVYDGIVITHGTDTMAYTSSALSYMLQYLSKPVVLTGAQLPLEEVKSDGKRNLIDAFKTAVSGVPGINIVFDGKIIKGCRAFKMRTENFDAYGSMNYPYIGRIINNNVELFTKSAPIKLDKKALLDTSIEPDVFLLKLIPGTRPELFDELYNMDYKGIVIESFGAGGIPYLRRNLLDKVSYLINRNIPVVVTTQCIYEGTNLKRYDVGVKAEKVGVISGYDMTTEAAVTKLMWVLGHTNNMDTIKKMMLTNYINEIKLKK